MKVCSKLVVKCAWGGKREGRISEKRASVEGERITRKMAKEKTQHFALAHLIK